MNRFILKAASIAQGAKACVIKKVSSTVKNPRILAMLVAVLGFCTNMMAQTTVSGSYDSGRKALGDVTSEIVQYIPLVQNICYAIAGVVAVLGAISVYIKMNNEEQDVKKSIMMIVGACLFLIAAAQALPLFFGLSF